jgi:hypothetical protein
MRRRAKLAKATVKGQRPPASKLRKNEGSRIHDLEVHLARALNGKAADAERWARKSHPDGVQPGED